MYLTVCIQPGKKGRLSSWNGTFITVLTAGQIDIIAKDSQDYCKWFAERSEKR